ncbi:MAG TPA: DNA repair protein RecO [Candidatus Saccharimonadales bacterium]|nr:DNA repair protein RecO [Candidatus Saccharimonadales bacterium]
MPYRQYRTNGLVIRRVDYGEADRILTLLTPEHGKVGAIAKGVRKSKSRLAGSIEFFAESIFTLVEGRGELDVVSSARLEHFYGNIMRDYDRLEFGYEAIKLLHKSTEDLLGPEFYQLLKHTFIYLDNTRIPPGVVEVWFRLHLEDILGRLPSLERDAVGDRLLPEQCYVFEPNERGLVSSPRGDLTADHIKLLRLAEKHSPAVLAQVADVGTLLPACLNFVRLASAQ